MRLLAKSNFLEYIGVRKIILHTPMTNKSLGKQGEDIAEKYLKDRGYKILVRNFTKRPWGEIDIVAEKKAKPFSFLQTKLVFVEVKSIVKRNDFFPEDQITDKKQNQLRKMAQIYLSTNKLPLSTAYQIDILAIEFDGNSQVIAIRHQPNAIEDNY